MEFAWRPLLTEESDPKYAIVSYAPQVRFVLRHADRVLYGQRYQRSGLITRRIPELPVDPQKSYHHQDEK